MSDFQERVVAWGEFCFQESSMINVGERTHRFLEEALELAQSTGCSKEAAHELVEYVFNRPKGESAQEVGGVMVTLAALCNSIGTWMIRDGEMELYRINQPEIIEKIRNKNATKPKFSPLPGIA
jgi:hypothetical protein